MNAVAISAPVSTTNKVETPVRTIKVTTLRAATESTPLFVEMHDEKGTLRRIIGHTFNTDKPVKAWEGQDGVQIIVEGRGAIHCINHGMKGPAYPVAMIIGKHKKARRVRLTVYTTADAVIGETEKAMAVKPEVVEAEVIDAAPVSTVPAIASPVKEVTAEDFPKPVKSDYETFGEWMAACKARKSAMREAGIEA